MSKSKIVATVLVDTRWLGSTEIEVYEVIWSDGGRSFEVMEVANGNDLTEDGSFDNLPTDDEIRPLLNCQHESLRVDDRGQFHCTVCGEELGR